VDLNTINFYNCSNPKSKIESEGNNVIDLSVYPNPSTGIYTVSYNLPESTSGQIMIYSADGRELKRFGCQTGYQFVTVDITGAGSGTYLYILVVDGSVVKSGSLILN
jgi:hypothetical protein